MHFTANTDKLIQHTSMNISILDRGERVDIAYDEVEQFHDGDSWFGCSVGFRAMQGAARILSSDSLWSRDNLYIVSGHPGDGVRDAIEVVTRCVSRKRFRLLDDRLSGCSRDMRFAWWVSDGNSTAHIELVEGFVPESFYQLLDIIRSGKQDAADSQRFDDEKNRLSEKLWEHPLDEVFCCRHIDTPLITHELPNVQHNA